MAANNQVDFVMASETVDELAELVTIPAYSWNRHIVVPKGHPLTKMLNITLADLASFPILTYMLGLSGRSQLDKTFQQANLSPRIAFTATDSDVIKTYVRLGLGAGIIAEMAYNKDDQELVYIDANHLFPDSLIKIGFRHSRHISAFQFVFLQMISPYLDMDTIKKIAATRTRAEQDKLLIDYQVPSFKAMQKTNDASYTESISE